MVACEQGGLGSMVGGYGGGIGMEAKSGVRRGAVGGVRSGLKERVVRYGPTAIHLPTYFGSISRI